MGAPLSKGTLVHIPQSVMLMDCEQDNDPVRQLSIPLRVHETEKPTIGVVTDFDDRPGYVRIYCEGNTWSVKTGSVYVLSNERKYQ